MSVKSPLAFMYRGHDPPPSGGHPNRPLIEPATRRREGLRRVTRSLHKGARNSRGSGTHESSERAVVVADFGQHRLRGISGKPASPVAHTPGKLCHRFGAPVGGLHALGDADSPTDPVNAALVLQAYLERGGIDRIDAKLYRLCSRRRGPRQRRLPRPRQRPPGSTRSQHPSASTHTRATLIPSHPLSALLAKRVHPQRRTEVPWERVATAADVGCRENPGRLAVCGGNLQPPSRLGPPDAAGCGASPESRLPVDGFNTAEPFPDSHRALQ
jgi:hypothetical protein